MECSKGVVSGVGGLTWPQRSRASKLAASGFQGTSLAAVEKAGRATLLDCFSSARSGNCVKERSKNKSDTRNIIWGYYDPDETCIIFGF